MFGEQVIEKQDATPLTLDDESAHVQPSGTGVSDLAVAAAETKLASSAKTLEKASQGFHSLEASTQDKLMFLGLGLIIGLWRGWGRTK